MNKICLVLSDMNNKICLVLSDIFEPYWVAIDRIPHVSNDSMANCFH
jgi:hypothetical protein